MNVQRGWPWLLLIALAAWFLGVSRVADAKQKVRVFRLDDVHAVWGFLTGYQYESYAFPKLGVPGNTRQSLLLGERLGVAGRGSVFHPRFWKWQLSANVYVSQRWYKQADGDKGWDHYVTGEYQFDSLILERHPYPIHLFGRRYTDVVRRDFARNFEVTTHRFGGDFTWQNGVLPIRISAERLTNDYGLAGSDIGDEGFTHVSAEISRRGPRDNGLLEYRMYDYTNHRYSDLNYRSHELLLQHVYYPGESPKRPYRLQTSARYTFRNATVDRDDGMLRETVTLRWLDAFETRLGYQFSTWNSRDNRTFRNSVDLDIRYRLYDSLFMGLFGQIGANTRPEGSDVDGSIGWDITYRKKILDIFVMSHTYQLLGSRLFGTSATYVRIVNEPMTLSGYEPVMLAQSDADQDGLEVLDPATQKQFVKDRDYEVRVQGSQVLVARLPGSLIPDGGSVLVSYWYSRKSGDMRTLEHRYIGRLQTTFSRHFILYGDVSERWTSQWTPSTLAERDRYESLGAGMNLNWSIVGLNLDVRRYRSDEFRSLDHSGTLTVRPSFGPVRTLFGARYLLQKVGGPVTEFRKFFEVFTEGSAMMAHNLTGQIRGRFHGEYGGPSDGYYVDGDATLQWRILTIDLRLEYRVQVQLRSDQRFQNHRVFFSIGRGI
ncbi:MAG: hypothetical protein GXP54_03755 [Deltaproteobacteria bacterium]|nr:hypothetical protein [Deltaproteobacteria bacterium]